MCGVVYDPDAPPTSDLFDNFDVAGVAVNMGGQYRRCAFGNSILDLRFVNGQMDWIDIDEDRRAIFPNNAANRRYVGERSRYYLSLQLKGFDRYLQSNGPIGDQKYPLDTEIFIELFF